MVDSWRWSRNALLDKHRMTSGTMCTICGKFLASQYHPLTWWEENFNFPLLLVFVTAYLWLLLNDLSQSDVWSPLPHKRDRSHEETRPTVFQAAELLQIRPVVFAEVKDTLFHRLRQGDPTRLTRGDEAGLGSFALLSSAEFCGGNLWNWLIGSTHFSLRWCYIWPDLGTITFESLSVAGSYFPASIIPKGSWAQNSPGTPRSAAFCIGAVWFSWLLLLLLWLTEGNPKPDDSLWKPAKAGKMMTLYWIQFRGTPRKVGFSPINSRKVVHFCVFEPSIADSREGMLRDSTRLTRGGAAGRRSDL